LEAEWERRQKGEVPSPPSPGTAIEDMTDVETVKDTIQMDEAEDDDEESVEKSKSKRKRAGGKEPPAKKTKTK
jgi:hypothetical protein